MRFQDKVAFVTGGASGLGAAAGARFASEGAKVVVADIDEDGARRVADGLPDAFAIAVDTADAPHPLHEFPVDGWRKVRGIDGDGVFYVMKYCIAEMLKTGGGCIVNNSSTAGLTGQANVSPYTFAKAGVIGLTRSAAIEYAAQNIRVNAIAPTVVWTPLVERFVHNAPDPAATRAAMQNYNPMPGIPRPEDIAAAVAFLASDEARWITGHTLPVDGGYCAQ